LRENKLAFLGTLSFPPTSPDYFHQLERQAHMRKHLFGDEKHNASDKDIEKKGKEIMHEWQLLNPHLGISPYDVCKLESQSMHEWQLLNPHLGISPYDVCKRK
jgi:hypothetical protein